MCNQINLDPPGSENSPKESGSRLSEENVCQQLEYWVSSAHADWLIASVTQEFSKVHQKKRKKDSELSEENVSQ